MSIQLNKCDYEQIDNWLVCANNAPEGSYADFDQLWKWAGYSRKDHAKTALTKNQVAGFDYTQHNFPQASAKPKQAGRPTIQILLTIKAAKQFLLQAETPQGKLVRANPFGGSARCTTNNVT